MTTPVLRCHVESPCSPGQARALKAVATVCRGLEAEHATTAEEAGCRSRRCAGGQDEAILEGSELSAGARSLVEWRLSRKRLLRQLRRSMEELSELMASDAKRAERKLRRALGAPPGAPPGGAQSRDNWICRWRWWREVRVHVRRCEKALASSMATCRARSHLLESWSAMVSPEARRRHVLVVFLRP